MSQKPTIGRIVIYYQGDLEAYTALYRVLPDLLAEEWSGSILAEEGPSYPGTNGTRFHPAIITQVWSDTCVNLTVLFGSGAVEPRQSSLLLPDEAFGDGVHCSNSGWRWPPRAAQ